MTTPKYHIYSIKLPPLRLPGEPPTDWLRYRPDIATTVRYGDLVEDSVSGLYVVDSDKSLVKFNDSSNALPLKFEAFTKFPVGYQFVAKRDPECKSVFTETFVPVPVLTDAHWIDLEGDYQYTLKDGYIVIMPKGYSQTTTEYYMLGGDDLTKIMSNFKPSIIDAVKKLSAEAKGVLLSLAKSGHRVYPSVELSPEEPSVKFSLEGTPDHAIRAKIAAVFAKYGETAKILVFGSTATVSFKEWNQDTFTNEIRLKLASGEAVVIGSWLCTGIVHKHMAHSYVLPIE